MKTKGGEIIHDFREDALGHGWNIVGFHDKGNREFTLSGVGLGIEKGHFILMKHNDKDILHEVDSIEYDSNPKDYFNLKMKGAWFFRKELLPDNEVV